MRLYRLETMIGMASYTFEFVAESDNKARELVHCFSAVVHPLSCGPLSMIGESDSRHGFEAINVDHGNARLIPLEVLRAQAPSFRAGSSETSG